MFLEIIRKEVVLRLQGKFNESSDPINMLQGMSEVFNNKEVI